MSSFTPRRWKSQAEPQTERLAVPPVGKFHAYRHGKPNNLRTARTPLIGREQEIEDITTLLRTPGFVTLVGAGGVGKTRCALQVATTVLGEFADGVWLVDLAPLADPALVASIVAQALDLPLSSNVTPLDTVVGYLKRKQLLLVLDNCEHVIEAARSVVATVLQNAPEVRLLATSREGLHVAGEQQYRMPSLAVPPAGATLPAQDVLTFGAARLFADRAVAIDRRFALSDDNASSVSEICRRLDGIPLAIELAAARVNVLTPQQLSQKLDERFRVVTGGDRSALPRQQTMRALIDWSYDLLSEPERMLFRKLAIFGGGFTLDTAAAVCSDGDMDEIVVLDLLSSLLDKSLVQLEAERAQTRYRLLESTRQYARAKLCDAAEVDAVSRTHARAFLELAKELDDAWESTADRDWYARAEPELENFRAALSWALTARGDVLLGQQLAARLRYVWYSFGPAEGRRWLQAAQQDEAAHTPTAVLAALDLAEAHLASLLTQYNATLRAGERALARYREIADPCGIVAAELQIDRAQVMLGGFAKAEPLLERTLESLRALGAFRSASHALQSLAFARDFGGDVPGARQRYIEALSVARTVGAERYVGNIVSNLAELEFRAGNVDAALRLADEAQMVFRAFRMTRLVAGARSNMAAYFVAIRRFEEARTAAHEAIAFSLDAQYSVGLAFTMQHLAAIASLRPSGEADVIEDCRRGARILGYADTQLGSLQAAREYTEQQEYEKLLPALRDAVGDDLPELMVEGGAWSEERAVAEALLV